MFPSNPLSLLYPLGTARCLLGTGDNTDDRTDKRQDKQTSSFYRASVVAESLEKQQDGPLSKSTCSRRATVKIYH